MTGLQRLRREERAKAGGGEVEADVFSSERFSANTVTVRACSSRTAASFRDGTAAMS